MSNEDFNEVYNVPDHFLTKRWPNPRLINNSPSGSDQALTLFLDEKYANILQKDGLDVTNIGIHARYCIDIVNFMYIYPIMFFLYKGGARFG